MASSSSQWRDCCRTHGHIQQFRVRTGGGEWATGVRFTCTLFHITFHTGYTCQLTVSLIEQTITADSQARLPPHCLAFVLLHACFHFLIFSQFPNLSFCISSFLIPPFRPIPNWVGSVENYLNDFTSILWTVDCWGLCYSDGNSYRTFSTLHVMWGLSPLLDSWQRRWLLTFLQLIMQTINRKALEM